MKIWQNLAQQFLDPTVQLFKTAWKEHIVL